MHRPIPDSCKVELLHYQIENPALVNKTFWRSCSFLLGAVIKNSFKDNVKVHLHSFPSPNGKFLLLECSMDKYFVFTETKYNETKF